MLNREDKVSYWDVPTPERPYMYLFLFSSPRFATLGYSTTHNVILGHLLASPWQYHRRFNNQIVRLPLECTEVSPKYLQNRIEMTSGSHRKSKSETAVIPPSKHSPVSHVYST